MFNQTRNFLKEHPDLLILQADKGGCTVAMDKHDYVRKTEELLQDHSTYHQLNKDPTSLIQTKYNKLIESLQTSNEITVEETKHFKIYNSSFPKLYCLPKIHKPNVPLRPIISSINSVTYNISKYLANILSQAFENETTYNIKDTFSFVNQVNGLQLQDNYVLISLDVVSLFTNIPLPLILKIIEQKWHNIEKFTKLTKGNFLKLINFIFDNTYFSFNNKFYKQIFGTPMGSPISTILTTMVLDHLLDHVIPTLPFQLPFIFKYVDDLICSVPAEHTQTILNIFNSFNEHIQFTIEMEKNNNSVPFLDTRVIRTQENKILLDWYQKDTASGRFLNFYSNHPTNQKYNTIIAMKNRITHISDQSFLKTNLNKILDIFINNGYPKHIAKRLIFNSNTFDGPTDDNAQTPQIKYKKILYTKNLTNRIISLFKSVPHLKIAKYNPLQNQILFSRIKDETPNLYKTNVVYKMSCMGCQSSYVGQTSQWLRQRITQHKSDCRLGKNTCAVVDHCLKTGHQFDYTNVKVLDQNDNYKKRLFLEMCHIIKDNNSINSKADTNQLSNIYCNILSTK